jgi:uncharacterized protein YndB with AHSA1/START domain
MPTVTRTRTIAAEPAEVWTTVTDPYHLPRWWPRVERVEGVDERGFTQVLRTQKGRNVRADFRWVEVVEGERCRWGQEVAGTPFERILAVAETEVRIARAGEGTAVTLALRQRLRGFARLGAWMVRRATRRQLDEALGALESLLGH